MVGKHRGDDFLQGRSLSLPLGWTPFHVCRWSVNNTRELCRPLRRCHVYTVQFIPVTTTATPFSLALPLTPYAHLIRCPIPERLCHSYNTGKSILLNKKQSFASRTFNIEEKCIMFFFKQDPSAEIRSLWKQLCVHEEWSLAGTTWWLQTPTEVCCAKVRTESW